MDEHMIAWAAGFFDGEGCVYIGQRSRNQDRMSSWRVSLEASQVIIDPLIRLQELFGGTVRDRGKTRRGNEKPQWIWSLSAIDQVSSCLKAMRPYLTVKAEKADIALQKLQLKIEEVSLQGDINRTKTRCPKGHFYDEANTAITPSGSRVCRACRREAGHRHDLKRRGRPEDG